MHPGGKVPTVAFVRPWRRAQPPEGEKPQHFDRLSLRTLPSTTCLPGPARSRASAEGAAIGGVPT